MQPNQQFFSFYNIVLNGLTLVVALIVAAALLPTFLSFTRDPVNRFIEKSYDPSWVEIGSNVWIVLAGLLLFFTAAIILYSMVQIVLARMTYQLGGRS